MSGLPRPRSVIETEIKRAEQEVAIAEDDLRDANERLAELDAELAALPDEGADDELWFAAHDSRQLDLLKARK